MKYRIKIGSRASQLALKQVEEVENLVPEASFDLIAIKTKGDKDKTTPLHLCEGSDFFTYEIEQTLLKGEIDAAIHSAKDLEQNLPDGLVIAAMTKSISRYDCLLSPYQYTLDSLPRGAVVGTSSKARKQGVLEYRNDLVIKDIRGNVQERINKLYTESFDAIIVAHAALIRLRLEALISQMIPLDIVKPHPLQGKLAIQVRKERKDLLEIFRRINENQKRQSLYSGSRTG